MQHLYRIALTGPARSGKDVVANILVRELGYVRHSFGDIIKRQLATVIRVHTGIDSYTEDDRLKRIIRPTLEAWSETNAEGLLRAYWESAPAKCVNNRLVKVSEAKEFRTHGGVIVWVSRPDRPPASAWESARLFELRNEGLVDLEIANDGTLDELRAKVLHMFRGGTP